MATWTQEARDKHPKEDFGDPEGRKFPIKDQSDVDDAAHLIGKAGNPEAVKKRIKAICKRKNLKCPEAWDKDGDCNMEATFDTSPSPLAALGDLVLRDAPVIFKCGDYPDKDFSLTPNEAKTIVLADFNSRREPVHLRPSHTKNPLDGKIGRIASLGVKDDGVLFGKVAIPRWLDEAFKGQPIPLSAGFDRATKKLTHVALVDSPRVDGARIDAAFQEHRKTVAQRETEIFKTLAEVKFDDDDGDMHCTPHGQRRLQHIHDLAASWGALCKQGEQKETSNITLGKPYFGSDEDKKTLEAIFTSAPEHGALQAIHDATTEKGACCSGAMLSELRANKGKGIGNAPAQIYNNAASTDNYGEKGYTFSMDKITDPAVAAFAAETQKQIAALTEAKNKAEANAEATRQQALRDHCSNFAKELVRENYILKHEEQNVYFALLQAGQDDFKMPTEVTFDVGVGQQQKGTRLDALKFSYKQRPQHSLTKELLEGGGKPIVVLMDQKLPGQANFDAVQKHGGVLTDEQYKNLMSMTPLGQSILDNRPTRREKQPAVAAR